MKLDGSIALFQYWNRLRDGRPAPKRTEIEPADIKTLLADTFILEKDARGEAVFRLAGTRLCATYGRELKGFAFASLWQEKDQRMIARLAHSAFDAQIRRGHLLSRHQPQRPRQRVRAGAAAARRRRREPALPRRRRRPANKPFWLGADPIVEAQIEFGARRRSGPRADVPEEPPGDRRAVARAGAMRRSPKGRQRPPHPPSRRARRRPRGIDYIQTN